MHSSISAKTFSEDRKRVVRFQVDLGAAKGALGGTSSAGRQEDVDFTPELRVVHISVHRKKVTAGKGKESISFSRAAMDRSSPSRSDRNAQHPGEVRREDVPSPRDELRRDSSAPFTKNDEIDNGPIFQERLFR